MPSFNNARISALPKVNANKSVAAPNAPSLTQPPANLGRLPSNAVNQPVRGTNLATNQQNRGLPYSPNGAGNTTGLPQFQQNNQMKGLATPGNQPKGLTLPFDRQERLNQYQNNLSNNGMAPQPLL